MRQLLFWCNVNKTEPLFLRLKTFYIIIKLRLFPTRVSLVPLLSSPYPWPVAVDGCPTMSQDLIKAVLFHQDKQGNQCWSSEI